MKRTTRNANKSKQEIIEKSAPIFNKFGYEGSKMSMIIAATGYQKGGIYCHFNNKKELAIAVFKNSFNQIKELYIKEIGNSDHPSDQLKAFIKAYKNFITHPPVAGGCPVLNMAIDVDDADEELRLIVKDAVDTWRNLLETILQKGVEEGVFNAEINPKQESLFIFACIEGSSFLGNLKRSTRLVFDIIANLDTYIEFKILKKD